MIYVMYPHFFLYADDTNMFVTGKNIENQIFLINTEFKKKVIWLNANK